MRGLGGGQPTTTCTPTHPANKATRAPPPNLPDLLTHHTNTNRLPTPTPPPPTPPPWIQMATLYQPYFGHFGQILARFWPDETFCWPDFHRPKDFHPILTRPKKSSNWFS